MTVWSEREEKKGGIKMGGTYVKGGLHPFRVILLHSVKRVD